MAAGSTAQLDQALASLWDGAADFPAQGRWSESAYLSFSQHANRLVEFSNGFVEVLPVPTQYHQMIVLALYRVLYQFVQEGRLGTLLVAPLRVQLWPGTYREPDLVFMLAGHKARRGNDYWQGADLVVEVVSPSNADHDRAIKRDEYARAGILEYWLVEPETETIMVLTLQEGGYQEYGVFGRGAIASSPLLDGCSIEVASIFETDE
jgi:Uma2 family endonuclease